MGSRQVAMKWRNASTRRVILGFLLLLWVVAIELWQQTPVAPGMLPYSLSGSRKLPKYHHPTERSTEARRQLVQPRAFDMWPEHTPLPCFPPDGNMTLDGIKVPHNAPVSQGFFFLKTFKTGSSTSAGVNLRIARNVAYRQGRNFTFCKARFDHGKPWMRHGSLLFGNRTIGESFLWAILRHPTQRAVSQFFHFKVGRKHVNPTDASFIELVQNQKKNYYVRSLSLEQFSDDRHDGFEVSNKIIQDYDFIGVTERIDESFVALSMILRVPLSDVLYMSAKVNGSYDAQCAFIPPSNLTSNMHDFLLSETWNDIIQEDVALYEAANRSLDLTIDGLGRAQFDNRLAIYREALALAQKRCIDQVIFPCGPDGKRNVNTTCLWNDSGCGSECLDQVAVELGI